MINVSDSMKENGQQMFLLEVNDCDFDSGFTNAEIVHDLNNDQATLICGLKSYNLSFSELSNAIILGSHVNDQTEFEVLITRKVVASIKNPNLNGLDMYLRDKMSELSDLTSAQIYDLVINKYPCSLTEFQNVFLLVFDSK